jgi:hypothetical protein
MARGGRFAVLDHFLLREDMSPEEARLFALFKKGQVVGELVTPAKFRPILESSGFVHAEYSDKLKLIEKGIAKSHRLSLLSFPFSLLLSKLRLLPVEAHAHTVSRMAARRLFAQGVMTYGGLVAEKA